MIPETVSVGIVMKIVFTGYLLIGIAWTFDVWCVQLIEIVQTNDLGDCLLMGIVLKIVFTVVFTGCLSIGIAWTIGDVLELKLLGQLLGQLHSETVH